MTSVWLTTGKLARGCPWLCMRQTHVILRPAIFSVSNLGLQSVLISSPYSADPSCVAEHGEGHQSMPQD